MTNTRVMHAETRRLMRKNRSLGCSSGDHFKEKKSAQADFYGDEKALVREGWLGWGKDLRDIEEGLITAEKRWILD